MSELVFYATCPKGLEDLLLKEIESLGLRPSHQSVGVVYFHATHEGVYNACLWSRVANRIFILLSGTDQSPVIGSDHELYKTTGAIDWEHHMGVESRFAVEFVGSNKVIKHSNFGAVRVKDAIVDRLRDKFGGRPDVAKENPDVRIQARLFKDKLQIGLDMGGGSLHQRGYRSQQGGAPLKENLAAAILMRAGWQQEGSEITQLVDPMCGSGTFLIEAAMMMTRAAPGLFRSNYGFQHWPQFKAEIWSDVLAQAQALFEKQLASIDTPIRIFGFDKNPKMVEFAHRNIANTPFKDIIQISERSIRDDARSWPEQLDREKPGLLLCNPPYGERLGDTDSLKPLYFDLANYVKQHYAGWTLGVFSGNPQLVSEMRMRAKKVNKFFNGPIACELHLFDILSSKNSELRKDYKVVAKDDLSEGAVMVLNRLQKNQRKLERWIHTAATNAYRLYDADLPEYAAAIDVYDDQLHVQEYAAPKSVAKDAAQKRLRELLMACAAYRKCGLADISVKTRQKNKGAQQYEKLSQSSKQLCVVEGKAKYWVNLWDYLDTGLFLDHRPLRRMVYEQAQGKKFLNLFCYTASITVAAALGGARSSVSVDMSKTYLDWALQNFDLNHLGPYNHKLVQKDCFQWLKECREGFDLIVLDPPTFSNSKRMDGVLDIQRDHVKLISRCMELLSPQGKLYFSNNLRGFKIDQEALSEFSVNDISLQTIDEDFKRNAKIHQCFLITHPEVTTK